MVIEAMASKEVLNAFRWVRAFKVHKAATKDVPKLSRYTNFTLGHIWEKYEKNNSGFVFEIRNQKTIITK